MVSKTISILMDINGDGFPDHVLRLGGDNRIHVKYNAMGDVGLLRTLYLPQGGSCSFTYTRVGNTVAMPQSRIVLETVTRDDGAEGLSTDRGAHSYTETYSYSGGYYDRTERLFYGFSAVTTALADGSVATTGYLNTDYYTRGMMRSTILRGPDADGSIVTYRTGSATVTTAIVRTVIRPSTGLSVAILSPQVAAETTRQYEPGTTEYVETGTDYTYEGAYGNITGIVQWSADGLASRTLKATIAYDFSIDGSDYLMQYPASIKVTDGNNVLLRYRTGSYGSSGELLTLDEYYDSRSYRRHSLSWDAYGNLTSITDARGHRILWTYDTTVHAFVEGITSDNVLTGGASYTSSMAWNYDLGVKKSETDENGQTMRYEYDGFGRLSRIWSPYDTDSLPAVSYDYDLSAFPWTATTVNKLLYDPADAETIRTVITIDGLGRALQTAKDGEYRDSVGGRHYGWNASGAVAYDAKGHAVSQGQPQFLETAGLPGLAAMSRPTATAFDALDRPTVQSLPDGSTMRTDYLVEGTRFVERSTDPLGNMSERETDDRGNVMAVRRLSAGGAVLMSANYAYDAMGQMLSAVDSKGNAVGLTYDLTGLRLSLTSADTGTILLTYDEAGNLAKKTDAVLRSHGESISYSYDGQGRLVKVTYPRTTATTYVYGDEDAGEGLVARLVSRTDASGTTSYGYGKLGETLTMTRTIDRLTPLAADLGASFSYVSDYLGRLQEITYPDGEVVTYGYDAGGQVKTVTGVHNGLTTTYVADIAYDAFGQRTYIEYGNGVRTTYAYDEDRRWLDSVRTLNSRDDTYQDMQYSFDLVGNVLGYTNSAGDYDTNQDYSYDDLYQLIGAKGTSVGRKYGLTEYKSSYSQIFTYDAIGNMTAKTSSVSNSPGASLGDDLNYSLAYSYYSGKAHQAERIGDLYYRYDGNGNIIEERAGGHGTSTVLAGEACIRSAT